MSAKKKQVSAGKGTEQNQTRWILLLFLVSFCVHAVLNIAVKEAPTVVIDEGLYTNIARSLAWDGELAFRGQPVEYPYLLYPFLLVPVYWIAGILNADVYRLIQVWNTLLMCSTVIPACLFARDFSRDRKAAFLTAVLVSVMPDLVMGGYTMAECVIWPLSFWMILFCCRFYREHRLRDGMLTALFTGLLFFAKPGAVAVGAVMLVFHLILSLKNNREELSRSLFPCLLLLAEIAAVYGIYVVLLHRSTSLLGLYTKQTSEWGGNDTLIAVEGFFLTAFAFCFACNGIWMILPLAQLKQYEVEDRRFILAMLLGTAAAILGTAIFVVPYKWDSLGAVPIHLRYCSMFVPVFFVFAYSLDAPRRELHRGLYITLIAVGILAIWPGVRQGFVPGKTSNIDSFVLSAFTTTHQLNGKATGWVATGAVILYLAFLIMNLRSGGWGKELKQFSALFFGLFLLFNAGCAYTTANVYIDPTVSADAREVNRLVGRQECLGVTQRYYDDIYSYWLDGRLIRPMQQVTADQIYFETQDTGGVYKPFVPEDQAPNTHNHETPDTDTLVLGMTVAEHLELSDSVTAETTANGHFTVARIRDSERWLDSFLYGMDDDTLHAGSSGIISVFDEGRNLDGMLHLNFTASGKGSLQVDGQKVELSPELKDYDITVPFKKQITINAMDADAVITKYSTQSQNHSGAK